MTDYWISNVGLTVIALIGLAALNSAPPRTKLYLCLVAMATWCVPWHFLTSIWASADGVVRYVQFNGLQEWVSPGASVESALPNFRISWETMFAVAAIFGICLFAIRVARQMLRQCAWLDASREVALEADTWRELGVDSRIAKVRVVDGLDNALVSGYFRPTIWLGDAQFRSPWLTSIVRHEVTHIRYRDNFVLLYVAFLADFFWWNPIVRFFARQSYRYVELGCDRRCQRLSRRYRDDLSNELLSQHYRHLSTSLVNPIARRRGFNTFRIRELAREIYYETSPQSRIRNVGTDRRCFHLQRCK